MDKLRLSVLHLIYKGTHAAEDVARDKPSALCIFLFQRYGLWSLGTRQ
ncbi:MAG: hypothetical protein AAB332_00520 [Planctomycetota bacterium]